jgi:methanesulfonate monooxygenase small subunit
MNRDAITDLIYDASRLLDDEHFDEWLNLCAPDFGYRITTFSDELGKAMTWMQQDKAGMAHVFSNVKSHERYTGRLRRHVSMPRVRADGGVAAVTSAVAVYHTETNGVTQLYAIGLYRDLVKEIDGRVLFAQREVNLDTRRLPFGSHVPI